MHELDGQLVAITLTTGKTRLAEVRNVTNRGVYLMRTVAPLMFVPWTSVVAISTCPDSDIYKFQSDVQSALVPLNGICGC